MSENHILVPLGEPMLPGDQSWDSDFERWEEVMPASFNKKVGSVDVIRRVQFDVHPLLRAILVQVEKLRTEPPDERWWHYTDTYISECKRRLGLRSYDGVTDDGVCIPAAVVEPRPVVGQGIKDEVAEFRRRNSKRPVSG